MKRTLQFMITLLLLIPLLRMPLFAEESNWDSFFNEQKEILCYINNKPMYYMTDKDTALFSIYPDNKQEFESLDEKVQQEINRIIYLGYDSDKNKKNYIATQLMIWSLTDQYYDPYTINNELIDVKETINDISHVYEMDVPSFNNDEIASKGTITLLDKNHLLKYYEFAGNNFADVTHDDETLTFDFKDSIDTTLTYHPKEIERSKVIYNKDGMYKEVSLNRALKDLSLTIKAPLYTTIINMIDAESELPICSMKAQCFDENSNLMQEATSDDKGQIVLENLKEAEYQLKLTSDGKYTDDFFTFKGNDGSLTFKAEPVKYQLSLRSYGEKVTSVSFTDTKYGKLAAPEISNAELEDITYSIKALETIYKSDGTLFLDQNAILETNMDVSLYKGNYEVSIEDAFGYDKSASQTITMDKDTELDFQLERIKEEKEIEVTIEPSRFIDEATVKSSLIFGLYAENVKGIEENTLISIIKLKDDKVRFDFPVMGDYAYKLLDVHEQYLLPEASYSPDESFNAEVKKGNLFLNLLNEDGDYAGDGITFDLYHEDTYIQSLTSSANNTFTLEKGTYTLIQKEVTNPYVLNPKKMDFEVNEGLVTVNFVNAFREVSLTIDKKDSATYAPINGALFELYSTNKDGTKNELIDTKKTQDGKIYYDRLTWGKKYILIEKESAAGYELPANNKWTIDMSLIEDSSSLYKEILNNKRLINVSIYKCDKDDHYKALANAVFNIHDDTKNMDIGTYTTDKDGMIYLPFIEYGTTLTITETDAPPGYVKCTKSYTTIIESEKDNMGFLFENSRLRTPDTSDISLKGF